MKIKKNNRYGDTYYYMQIRKIDKKGNIKITDEDRNVFYFNKEYRLHRDGDKPAVIKVWGPKEYLKNGKIHRDGDKPAIIHYDGTKEWWINNKRHRECDKPAIEYEDGRRDYYKNGKQNLDANLPKTDGSYFPKQIFRP